MGILQNVTFGGSESFYILAVFLVVTLLYSFIIAIYNVFFHPLSIFPGPRLHAATRIRNMQDFASGKYAYKMQALHEKYGEVVRIAPNELSYIDSAAWKDIYGSRPGQPQMQKDLSFFKTPDPTPSIFLANDADHSRMRRLLAHAFSDKALQEEETIIHEYVDLMISKLHEIAGTDYPADLVKWFNWTTFDLFGDLCYGQSFGCLKSGESHPLVKIITEGVQGSAYLSIICRIPGIERFIFKIIPKRLIEKMFWLIKYSHDLSDQRMAMNTDRKDFMSYIMRYNDEKGMSVPEIRATSVTLIVGGSETTASTLSAIVWYMLKHPAIYSRLKAEIRAVDNSDFTNANLANMPYLNAVIKEGLRLYPPAPIAMNRVVPGKGSAIMGKWVPGGTIVGYQNYAGTHSPSNFNLADSFIPERWLGDPRFASDDSFSSQPFAYGPRNCIGKNLAWLELRLILAQLLWNFDLELQADSEKWFPHTMYVVWNKPPLNVRLKPVARTCKA